MHGHRFKDLTGQKFGRLQVVSFHGRNKNNQSIWLCRCDCKTSLPVESKNLLSGTTKSCGCLMKELAGDRARTHGQTKTRAYKVWINIKDRCFNPRHKSWKDYGGRGITMHPAWRDSFEAFYRDVGEPPVGLSIDRKNNDGNYEPGNVRFTDMFTQHNNRRGNRLIAFNGKIRTIAQWARIVGVKKATLYKRFEEGWSIKRTLTTP